MNISLVLLLTISLPFRTKSRDDNARRSVVRGEAVGEHDDANVVRRLPQTSAGSRRQRVPHRRRLRREIRLSLIQHDSKVPPSATTDRKPAEHPTWRRRRVVNTGQRTTQGVQLQNSPKTSDCFDNDNE